MIVSLRFRTTLATDVHAASSDTFTSVGIARAPVPTSLRAASASAPYRAAAALVVR